MVTQLRDRRARSPTLPVGWEPRPSLSTLPREKGSKFRVGTADAGTGGDLTEGRGRGDGLHPAPPREDCCVSIFSVF